MPSVQGAFLFFDEGNGSLKAIIDGALLTKWKTAADSVLGANLLANRGPRKLVIVGAGAMASAFLEAYLAVFPSLETVSVWARNPDRAEMFVSKHGKGTPIVTAVDDLQGAVQDADIITTVTASSSPVLRGEWVMPGTHVDLAGAYRPDMREADDDLITKGRLFVDCRETTLDDIGELKIPLAAGTIKPDDILGEFSVLVTKKAGRQTSDEITVFKNGGGAHLDVMIANYMLSKLEKSNDPGKN